MLAEQIIEQTLEWQVIWDAMTLMWRLSNAARLFRTYNQTFSKIISIRTTKLTKIVDAKTLNVKLHGVLKLTPARNDNW